MSSIRTLGIIFLIALSITPQAARADVPAGKYQGVATTSKQSRAAVTIKYGSERSSASGTINLSGLIFKVKGTIFDGTNTLFGTATYVRPDGSKDRRSLTGTYNPVTSIFTFEIPVRGGKGKAIFNTKSKIDNCSEIIGFWAWFTGGVVNINANNTHSTTNDSQGTISGTWECTNVKGNFVLNWENGTYIDTLTISEDGKSLSGTNQYGVAVSGNKL